MKMPFKSTGRVSSREIPFSPDRQFTLFLAGILALMLAACGGGGGEGGGGGGGGGVTATCTLSQSEIDELKPTDVLPAGCDFLAVPPIVGLFILGTEISDGTNGTTAGELKLYVNGVKQNGEPMTLEDFRNATLAVDGVPTTDWEVEAADGDVLSIVTLADYSGSISVADLIGMGNLYDTVLENSPTGFEAETINFSTFPITAVNALALNIVVKPGPLPHWTTALNDLLAANDYDSTIPNVDTPLYAAMGTGLMGPLDDAGNASPGDRLGLVERNNPDNLPATHRPATLLMVQTDGIDNASNRASPVPITEDEIVSLMDRCNTTAIMLGTFQADDDVERILEGLVVLERLAGDRGAFVNALNASFLEAAITPFAKSLGNLAVFTLSPANVPLAGEIVTIEVDDFAKGAKQPFDIPPDCQDPSFPS